MKIRIFHETAEVVKGRGHFFTNRISNCCEKIIEGIGIRITEKLNFPPNFQFNLNGMDFSEVIQAKEDIELLKKIAQRD